MPDSEAESIDEYLCYLPTPDGCVLQVGVVEWVSSHEPSIEWKDFRHWRTEPSAKRQEQAKAAALKRYFRKCSGCGEWCNLGHMHDRDTCQGCAERLLGVDC